MPTQKIRTKMHDLEQIGQFDMNRKGFSIIYSILIGVVALVVIAIWITYGTLNPCGMVKKEIANQVRQQSGESQAGYFLFGGFIDRAIDTLSPLECISVIYKVKTGSKIEDVLKSLEKGF